MGCGSTRPIRVIQVEQHPAKILRDVCWPVPVQSWAEACHELSAPEIGRECAGATAHPASELVPELGHVLTDTLLHLDVGSDNVLDVTQGECVPLGPILLGEIAISG